MKIHKNPLKTRPIVSSCGTYIHAFSRWVDYHLQKIREAIPTYIRDSQDLVTQLKQLGTLPSNARLFTADATSMYTNISPEHGIATIRKWFGDFENELPLGYPTELILEVLELIMKNNIFEFGDSFFLQLIGTAMGTPVACIYATIYYAYHERTYLLQKYARYLCLLRRFIDDMFGIWTGTDKEFKNFKNDLTFGQLKWTCIKPTLTVDFLDLTLAIENRHISTKTYQEELNLYLYIPPRSAHPPGMIKGVIASLLNRYKWQNTHQEDFINIVKLLFQRLLARGWSATFLKQEILKYTSQNKENTPTSRTLHANNTAFLHIQYHPYDIPRKTIRSLYEKTCGDTFRREIGIEHCVVAYSRPKNLRDLLTPTTLHQAPGKETSTYLGEGT